MQMSHDEIDEQNFNLNLSFNQFENKSIQEHYALI